MSLRIFLFPFFVRSLQVHVCLFKIKSAFSVTACVVAFLKLCLLLVFDASRTPFLFAPLYFLLFLLHVVCSAV